MHFIVFSSLIIRKAPIKVISLNQREAINANHNNKNLNHYEN